MNRPMQLIRQFQLPKADSRLTLLLRSPRENPKDRL